MSAPLLVVSFTASEYKSWLAQHFLLERNARRICRHVDMRGRRPVSIIFLPMWYQLAEADLIAHEARVMHATWGTRIEGLPKLSKETP